MTMTRALLAALTFIALVPPDAGPAAAQTATCRPWCVYYGGVRGGGTNCGFISFEQCMWTAQGSDVLHAERVLPAEAGREGRPARL